MVVMIQARMMRTMMAVMRTVKQCKFARQDFCREVATWGSGLGHGFRLNFRKCFCPEAANAGLDLVELM